MKQSFLKQFIPIPLTIITFLALSVLLFGFIHFLNLFPATDKIAVQLRVVDILVGLTIYLKTSVDFAIFIGNLMSKNLGIKNRIAIEIGTALGNAIGTLFVLLIWTFFKEVPFLMIGMIFLAALVLLRLSEETLEELVWNRKAPIRELLLILKRINDLFFPVIRFIIPRVKKDTTMEKTFLSLFLFSLTIPLLLGLDDFAGYIPLFSIVNVFGFAIGVFLGHMLLNIFLFASPNITIRMVKQPFIALLGSLAFIGIALWGFVEITQILLKIF